jgi:ribose transport system ATP-binding protein
MANRILEMKNISKVFPGVRALENVSFDCIKGEVHALVGENGAGKSTLMKILVGAYQPDEGTILFDGQPVRIASPHDAQVLGISVIYQEFNLLPYLTVAENLFVGRVPRRNRVFVDWPRLRQDAEKLLARLDIDIPIDWPVSALSVAQQQLVEVAKALSWDADLIVMDEPSAALTGNELDKLFAVIKALQKQGVTTIYISHRLDEIFEIADRVTVLKDGQLVATMEVKETDKRNLIRLMVGHEIDDTVTGGQRIEDKLLLEVKGLRRVGTSHEVNLKLYKGEILGIAGLVGAGRTELVRSIFGADPKAAGEIYLNGRPLKISSPRDAVRAGLGLVTEDRKQEGLILNSTLTKNIALPSLDHRRRFIFVEFGREKEVVLDGVKNLDIKTPGLYQEVQYLSGGNQQKAVLAKWLAAGARVIIFDEPTRGIDVGAKREIHRLMRRLADEGVGIIMISSELPEIMLVSDRILVMRDNAIVAEFARQEATEEKILLASTGVKIEESGSTREG